MGGGEGEDGVVVDCLSAYWVVIKDYEWFWIRAARDDVA